MPTSTTTARRRFAASLSACLTLCLVAIVGAAEDRAAAGSSDGKAVFNGKDLSGWKFKDQGGAGAWKVVGDVKLDPSDPKKLVGTGEGSGGSGGVLLRGPFDHGSDVYTEQAFG